MTNSLGKKLRHRVEWFAVFAIAWLIPKLPRQVVQLLADVGGAAASILHLSGRRVALTNIDCAFGESLSATGKRRLVRQSYQSFARAMADLFWSPRLTCENLRTIFDLDALEQFKQQRLASEGVIFACLHYGGFEWIALALGLSGFNCTVVTQAFKNPLLNATFNQLREISGQQTVRSRGALLRLFKALRDQRNVTLAVDLTVSAKLPSVPITCFGMETCVTFAHAWLQQRTGAAIIPTHCEPMADGRYRLVLHPPIQLPPRATHQEIAQACWDSFEPVIRRNPAPWLWMYKHWRYRPAHASERYPDYANHSPHFSKLLARTAKEKTSSESLANASASAVTVDNSSE